MKSVYGSAGLAFCLVLLTGAGAYAQGAPIGGGTSHVLAGGQPALLIEKDARDFDFSFEVKTSSPCVAALLFRAHEWPILPAQEGVAPTDLPKQFYGYKVSLDTRQAEHFGAVEEVNGRGLLVAASPDLKDKIEPAGANKVRVIALGPVIEVQVNGLTANRLFDERFIQGDIAFRVEDTPDCQVTLSELALRRIEDPAWRALFNGADLTGWKNYGEEEFLVEDGVIVGRSGPKKSEGYLCTEESWKDFRVRGACKMLGAGNYGFFCNSTITLREDGYPLISGVQIEVQPEYPGSTGLVYESYRRGWLTPPDNTRLGAYALRPGEWNEIEIRLVGNHLTSWVNGVMVADFFDPNPQVFEGGFALQLHTGGVEGILWKDLYVRQP